MNSRNTSLSKRILGKDLNDLTYEDIESFFKEEKEETENLEFKSGNGGFDANFTKNIIRTIAAFLNSSGGILIWGAPTEKKVEKGNPKVCIGNLTPLNESKDKDQLINRISSSISYMPTGVNLVKLEKDEKYIYVFEVKESTSKPHQYNGIYYIRLDGQTKPAPHYLVDSLFKQVKFADVRGYIKFKRLNTTDKKFILEMDIIMMNHSPFLNAEGVSYRIICDSGLFESNNLGDYESVKYDINYGRVPTESINLHLDYEKIERKDNKFSILMELSGENIEGKTSWFDINITGHPFGGFNTKAILPTSFENRSYFENDLLNNRLDPNQTIKKLIGRDPLK